MSKYVYLVGLVPVIVTSLVLTICPPATAQVMKKIVVNGEDGVCMLPELGAVIIGEEGALKVMAISPGDHRPAAYRTIDLQEGDVVIMANGIRLAKPLELDSLYKAAKVGVAIKLGIKRGDKMMIVTFPKADEKDLPKRKMMIMGGQNGGEDTAAQTMTFTRKLDAPADVDNLTPLVGAAVILGDKKGKVVIAGQLDLDEADPRSKEFKTGDIVISVADKAITTATAAGEVVMKIADGQDVKFIVERDGKQHTIIVTKKSSGAVIKVNRK